MRPIASLWLIAMISTATACAKSANANDIMDYFGEGDHLCRGLSLVKQGFSGNLSRESSAMEFVGRLSSSNKMYFIYYHHFENPQTLHGHHRVVVMGRNCQYVGSYIIDYAKFRTSGSSIIFDVPKDRGNRIDFKNSRPPGQAWIDGTLPELIR